jgi:hypothetical protein
VHLRLEHQSFGIHEQVALSAFDLLATITTPLLSAYPGGLGRLGVHYPSAGFGIALESNAQAFADRVVQPLPSAVDAPSSEVMKDGLPRWEVVRQKAPRAATPQDIEEGVEDLAPAVDRRSTGGSRDGKMRLQARPFCVREVGWVRLSHACYSTGLLPNTPFSDSLSRQFSWVNSGSPAPLLLG